MGGTQMTSARFAPKCGLGYQTGYLFGEADWLWAPDLLSGNLTGVLFNSGEFQCDHEAAFPSPMLCFVGVGSVK